MNTDIYYTKNIHTLHQQMVSCYRYLHLPPELFFYPHILWYVVEAYFKVKYGSYNNEEWKCSSLKVLNAIEDFGGRFHISGLDNIRKTPGPVVFISNHMSVLETFVLPSLILPEKSLTYILKKSLLAYPIFGSFLRYLKPIVVSRTNPREDLKIVLTEGASALKRGKSLVIFPQHTRTKGIRVKDFNSLGVKLALEAGVPAIPVALKTDFWGNGTLIKDMGPIGRSCKEIFIKFGEPLSIKGKGREEHKQIIGFIKKNYDTWSARNNQ
ncbi:MAG: lysophospholipid acyltransferase family protein [bacterium]